MIDSWWTEVDSGTLAQGDYLPNCSVINIPKDFDPHQHISEIGIEEQNVIVMTQSCDLFNNKAEMVALCPVYTLEEMEEAVPKYKNKGVWESVRQGRNEALHMLGGFSSSDNRESLVVDFRQVYSLPLPFLSRFALSLGARKRLHSPYLERLSQSFARFFMRVGLPSDIPQFK